MTFVEPAVYDPIEFEFELRCARQYYHFAPCTSRERLTRSIASRESYIADMVAENPSVRLLDPATMYLVDAQLALLLAAREKLARLEATRAIAEHSTHEMRPSILDAFSASLGPAVNQGNGMIDPAPSCYHLGHDTPRDQ